MILGLPIDLRVTLMNTGVIPSVPVSDDLVSDMSLDLISTADGVSVKTIKVGDGITNEQNGVFRIQISGEDTGKLPKSGNALLKGVLTPCNVGLRIKLGKIESI